MPSRSPRASVAWARTWDATSPCSSRSTRGCIGWAARPATPSARLALDIASVPGVEVVGLLTHAGHGYRASDPDELRTIATREVLDMTDTAERCEREGLPIREISVGSTPTARIAAAVPGVTEIRPGTYVFNDVQQLRLGIATEETCAARVLATVVARPTAERFLIDGGTKSFSSDGGDGPPFPGGASSPAGPTCCWTS